jgi:hypothetical protein
MKRTLILVLVFGLVFGAFASAEAAKKKKKKPKPVETVLFFHGTAQFGEQEMPDHVTGATYMEATPAEPSGSDKSMQILNYGRGPNPNCAGNALFPVWVGKMAGTIVGDVKVKFTMASTPAKLDVRLWPDIGGQACNEAYPEPVASKQVDVPPGQGELEVVLEDVNIPVATQLMIQINPYFDQADQAITPFIGRIFYDGATAMSGVTFQCLPPAGANSCVAPAE